MPEIKSDKKDPRRNLPKGFFLREDQKPVKTKYHISSQDVILILALAVGWGLVGFFLFYQTGKVRHEALSSPAVPAKEIIKTESQIPLLNKKISEPTMLENISIQDPEIFDDPGVGISPNQSDQIPQEDGSQLLKGKIMQPKINIPTSEINKLLLNDDADANKDTRQKALEKLLKPVDGSTPINP